MVGFFWSYTTANMPTKLNSYAIHSFPPAARHFFLALLCLCFDHINKTNQATHWKIANFFCVANCDAFASCIYRFGFFKVFSIHICNFYWLNWLCYLLDVNAYMNSNKYSKNVTQKIGIQMDMSKSFCLFFLYLSKKQHNHFCSSISFEANTFYMWYLIVFPLFLFTYLQHILHIVPW